MRGSVSLLRVHHSGRRVDLVASICITDGRGRSAPAVAGHRRSVARTEPTHSKTAIPVPSGRHDRDAETNVLVGGFMMTTMRPTMRSCSGTSLPAADDPTGVPVSTSPQVGGFIIWHCGAHDDGTGLTGVREPQMNRNTALRLLDSRSSCSRTNGTGHRRSDHWANEPTTSTTPASSFGSTVTSSCRWIRTRRNNAESEGLRVQETPGTPITLSHEGFMTRQQDGQSAWLIVRAR